MILNTVRASVGVDEVNRRVRGAIVGAIVVSRSPAVYFAGVGSRARLEEIS